MSTYTNIHTTHHSSATSLPISPELSQKILGTIETALRSAGELLLAEFKRPDGPRGSGGHADIDKEVELFIRNHVANAFPTQPTGPFMPFTIKLPLAGANNWLSAAFCNSDF